MQAGLPPAYGMAWDELGHCGMDTLPTSMKADYVMCVPLIVHGTAAVPRLPQRSAPRF